MKPYYEHSGIVIYHGDCLALIPSLPVFDLLLTDPPYGMSFVSGQRDSLAAFGPITGDESIDVARAGVTAAFQRLKSGRHLYVFGPSTITESLPATKQTELIWDKGRFSAGDLSVPWGAQHERINFAAKPPNIKPSMRPLRRGSIIRHRRVDGQNTTHPAEKPIGLLRELIEVSSRFGEIVCDPFAGSGSVLLAALIEGRNAIGIELEERYCEIAAKRLNAGVLPLESAV